MTHHNLSPDDLSKLTGSQLSALPPDQVAKLSPDLLSKLSPNQLSKVFPNLTSRVIPRVEPKELPAGHEFLAATFNFIERNRHKIARIQEQRGGWEGWLQVELAYFLQEQVAPPPKYQLVDGQRGHYLVDREQAVFASPGRQRIDIWGHERWLVHPSYLTKCIGIELKCGGDWADTLTKVANNFQKRMMNDISKIAAGLAEGATGLGARVYAIGVTSEIDDVTWLDLYLGSIANTGMEVCYWKSMSLYDAATESSSYYSPEDCLYVLWCYRDFPRTDIVSTV